MYDETAKKIQEKLTEKMASACLPPLALIQKFGDKTHEQDCRLVKPVLHEIAERQAAGQTIQGALGEDENSSDPGTPPVSPRANKPESNRESLLNIAAELEEDLPPPEAQMVRGIRVDQNSYLVQWFAHVAHLHWEGVAICWKGLDERDIKRKKVTCTKVEDIGTTEICALCVAGKTSKKRRLTLASERL